MARLLVNIGVPGLAAGETPVRTGVLGHGFRPIQFAPGGHDAVA